MPQDPPGANATPPPAEAPARMDFLELLYGIIFNPRKTMRQAAENPLFSQALVVFLIVNILSSLLMAVSLGSRFPGRALAFAPVALVVAGLVVGFIDWFVVTGVFHLLAGIFGGHGKGLALFALIALANLPRLVDVPLGLLAFTPLRALGVVLGLVVTLWVAVLYVIAISEVHGLSTGQSVAVLTLPLLAVILGLIIIAVAFAGLFAALLPLLERGAPILPRL